jgi:transcriptional regulator with XRE-family HTH domain
VPRPSSKTRSKSSASLYKLISRHFGAVLRQRRLARGWSQQTLSMKARVDRTYISQVERGGNSPTVVMLCRLSRTLQVSPCELIAELEQRLGGASSER